MKKLILLCLLSLCVLSAPFSNATNLQQINALDGKVRLLAPEEFTPMPTEMLRQNTPAPVNPPKC